MFSKMLSVRFCGVAVACAVSGLAMAADLGPQLSAHVPGPREDGAWSVFVGKDFTVSGSVAELEGRAFVRGDFVVGKANYVVGRAGGGSKVYPPLDVPTLVVGGSLSGNGSLNLPNRPSIQVGSNIDGTVSFIDRGAVITGGVDTAAADALLAELQAKSRYWGALPDTEGGSITSRWGGVYIAADGANGNPKTWVFNLSFDLTSSFWGVEFTGFEDGDTILVNCKKPAGDSGFVLGVASYAINGKNKNSPFGARLLWNVPEADSVTLSGPAAFQGSVLVGNPASLTTVSVSTHAGRFVTCGSAVHTGNGGCAFHNYPFTGSLPERPAAALRGTVKIDADRTQTLTDLDVPGADFDVALFSDPDGDGDAADGVLLQTVTAGAEGAYAFEDLFPGHYVVAVLDGSGKVLARVPVALADGVSDGLDLLCEIDPSGYFYDVADGRLVAGGSVAVEGAGAVVKLDGRAGLYYFVTTNRLRATYVVTVTPPSGYVLDPARPVAGAVLNPSGQPDPFALGSGLLAGDAGRLADRSAGANPYYLVFELGPGDPFVLNNNIPLVKSSALSASVDLDVYVSGSAVKIDVWTAGETAKGDIVVYAWLDGAWAEVARVPSEQVVGEGANRYTVPASGLSPDGVYRFMVTDESGRQHVLNGKKPVKRLRLSAARKCGTNLEIAFSADQGRKYRVLTSSDLVTWSEQPASVPTARGWSGNGREPFTASSVDMQVRVPVDGRRQAFFKVVRVDE